jgi:hypothetical protein
MATLPPYVEVEKGQVLDYLLRNAELSAEEQSAIQAADDQARKAIVGDLEALEAAPINQQEGALKILIKDTHVNLRGSLWEVLQLGIELLIEHKNPLAIVGAVGRAIHNIREKVTRIKDPVELLTAKAIVRVAAAKKRAGKIIDIPEVSVEEITKDLRDHGFPAAPPNLSELVAHLRGEGVVRDVFHNGRGPYYVVTF